MSQTMAFQQSRKPQNKTSFKKGSGCLKCGKTGHWARDCTAPREERIDLNNSSNNNNNNNNNAASQRSDTHTQPAPEGNNDNSNPDIGFWDFGEEAAPAEGKLAELAANGAKRKQPKLESRHFVQEDGVPLVYTSFPGLFRKRFKGPGHEVGDLRRFFELYERWHHKMFPSKHFNVFVERMEAFSSRGEIQSCLATLRNREVHGIDPFGGMFGDEDPVGEEQDPASADGHHTPTTGAAGATVHNDLGFEMEEEEEDEEDYMVHLQRQEEDEAEPALCQTNTPAQLTEDVRKRIQENKRLAMEKLAARKLGAVDAAPTTDATANKHEVLEPTQAAPESEEPAKADVEDEEEEAYLRNLENEFESFENIAPAASAPLQEVPASANDTSNATLADGSLRVEESAAEEAAAGAVVQEEAHALEVASPPPQAAHHCEDPDADAAADYGFEFDDGTGEVEAQEAEEEVVALGGDAPGPAEVVLETEATLCMDETEPTQEIAMTSADNPSKCVEHSPPPGSASPVFSRQRRCKDLTDSESEED